MIRLTAAVITAVMLTASAGTAFAVTGRDGVMPPVRVYELMKQGSGFWLIDVRSPAEFDRCHIEGSMNIPLEELAQRTMPAGKLVVLVDDSLGGLTADGAVSLIAGKGAKNVAVLDGGLYTWASAGYPLAGEDAAGRRFLPVEITVDEFREARSHGVNMELYDLCGDKNLSGKVFPGAKCIEGGDLDSRLTNLEAMLSGRGSMSMSDELKKKPCVVLLLPEGADSDRLVRVSRMDVGDVRYLSGGYGVITAQPGRTTLRNTDGCSTCP